MRVPRAVAVLVTVPALLAAQGRPRTGAAAPAAVTGARYSVRIDPRTDVFSVRAEFTLGQGRDTVRLSLPSWTPGAYETDDYARWVHHVRAEADGRAVFWDKADKDTWRLAAAGARTVALEFQTNPDSLMLNFSGILQDFAWFNGTNLFVYPEGADLGFASDVTIEVPEGWRIGTGLDHAGGNRYRAASYHDLVDAPVYAGRLFVDSVIVDERPIRFVAYPDSAVTPPIWDSLRSVIRQLATAQNRIVGGPPYAHYTILFMVPPLDLPFGGGLEHANSQFDVISMQAFAHRQTGQLGPFTGSLLSHEFFHLFNVKRVRPAEMWPYDYGREQYTPLLWWSEGVTDYYGDVTATRGGVWDAGRFVASVQGNINAVEDAPEIVAAEDASTNTWIHPVFVDESQYYYPKGSLLGLMLDIRIRTATSNQRSLDDVFRVLWNDHYRRGRGFSTPDLLRAIRQWYPGVDDFHARYVNGREPLPYQEILPLAALAVTVDEARLPRVGVNTAGGPGGAAVEILGVVPGSMAADAGLLPGDSLVRIGEIPTSGPGDWATAYRARYRDAEGQTLELVWRRGGQEMRGRATVRTLIERTWRVSRDPSASGLPRQVFESITGQEGR